MLPGLEKALYAEKLDSTRRALVARLVAEGEEKLAEKLGRCGEESALICTGCHARRVVKSRCKATWCPCCQPAIAAQRNAELQPFVTAMKWPLFVTLTTPNTPSAEGLREVVKAFLKLRRKKIWKARAKGGVAAYEITNKGTGFHPHIHMVVDCEWLAIKTPAPRRGAPREEVARLCEAAQEELCVEWAKCMGNPGQNWVWVTRAKRETILKEVAKYSIKCSDLIKCEGSAGDLIRAIKKTRTMTTWGALYKRGPKPKREAQPCPCCGEIHSILPETIVASMALQAAQREGVRRARY